METKHIYIPVGWRCDAAARARTHGLREVAYPFDWTIQHYNSMYYLLKNGMSKFLKGYTIGEKKYKAFYDDKGSGTKDLQSVYCHKSQCVLVHDYRPGVTIEDIKNKYTRRYERMISDIQSADKITLIVDEWNEDVWNEQVKLYKQRLKINIREVWNQTKTLEDIIEAIQDIHPKAEIDYFNFDKLSKKV